MRCLRAGQWEPRRVAHSTACVNELDFCGPAVVAARPRATFTNPLTYLMQEALSGFGKGLWPW
jgi:hypothetical protein